jgi:hypothetical protein
MADLPDFLEQPTAKRDWASKINQIKSFIFENATALEPGGTYDETIYTTPSGKAFFLTEVSGSSSINGRGGFYIYGLPYWWRVWTFERQHIYESYSVPLILVVGQELRGKFINDDIVSGYGYMSIDGWEEPASEPKKPKSDDPIDLYKAGEFNYCSILVLPDGESVRIFRKVKEDKVNYLRIKNLYRPTEKKLASFHLKPEHTEEILSTLRAKPEKVIKVLEDFEQKYGKKGAR